MRIFLIILIYTAITGLEFDFQNEFEIASTKQQNTTVKKMIIISETQTPNIIHP